jgi:thiamine biosynthesis protein ThiI
MYGEESIYKYLMIKYGELGLKGKNKAQFIHRLVKNIEAAVAPLKPREIISNWGRIMVPVDCDMVEVIDRLERVFGIYAICPVVQAEKDLDKICEAAVRVLTDTLPAGGTFKVESRRPDKTFPVQSPELSKKVAAYIFDHVDESYDADMHHPQAVVNVEVRKEGALIYSQSIPGAKGMPVGSGGHAVVMLSGGIDSPVATWMALKRGVTIEAVHFESFPFTSERAKEKVIDLCRCLSRWSNAPIKLHCVHFTEIQTAIHEHCREDYGITIMRRFMFRLAERIARQNNGLAIYTGESVGQVASQTLESMFVINEVTTMPVLRPLVGMDKEEIMAKAKKIGTYDTSIRPYEDCCTVFLPKYPKIRPRLDEAKKMEAKLDVEALIEAALEQTEVLKISAEAPYDF